MEAECLSGSVPALARRFATYKRANPTHADIEKLALLANNPKCPVQFVFAGRDKLPSSYENVSAIGLRLLVDYDINVGRHLVQVWVSWPSLSLSREPQEETCWEWCACGGAEACSQRRALGLQRRAPGNYRVLVEVLIPLYYVPLHHGPAAGSSV